MKRKQKSVATQSYVDKKKTTGPFKIPSPFFTSQSSFEIQKYAHFFVEGFTLYLKVMDKIMLAIA